MNLFEDKFTASMGSIREFRQYFRTRLVSSLGEEAGCKAFQKYDEIMLELLVMDTEIQLPKTGYKQILQKIMYDKLKTGSLNLKIFADYCFRLGQTWEAYKRTKDEKYLIASSRFMEYAFALATKDDEAPKV